MTARTLEDKGLPRNGMCVIHGIQRNHSLSVKNYIVLCKFSAVSEPIMTINFQLDDQDARVTPWDVAQIYPKRPVTSDEFISTNCRESLVPGDLLHLLPLAAQWTFVGCDAPVVELGNVIQLPTDDNPNQRWVFGIIPDGKKGRELHIIKYDFPWTRNCSFIAVPKSKILMPSR